LQLSRTQAGVKLQSSKTYTRAKSRPSRTHASAGLRVGRRRQQLKIRSQNPQTYPTGVEFLRSSPRSGTTDDSHHGKNLSTTQTFFLSGQQALSTERCASSVLRLGWDVGLVISLWYCTRKLLALATNADVRFGFAWHAMFGSHVPPRQLFVLFTLTRLHWFIRHRAISSKRGGGDEALRAQLSSHTTILLQMESASSHLWRIDTANRADTSHPLRFIEHIYCPAIHLVIAGK